jgi:hypothetical protein
MLLKLEDGTTINKPTAVQIDEALRTLDWRSDNSFAILERAEWFYLQTAQEDVAEQQESFYFLEYQEGSLDEHYGAVDGPITLDRVIEAFQKYARGDNSWLDDFTWEKMDLELG